MFDAKILNNIIMQIADGKISAGSKHRVFSDNDKEDGDALGLPSLHTSPPACQNKRVFHHTNIMWTPVVQRYN